MAKKAKKKAKVKKVKAVKPKKIKKVKKPRKPAPKPAPAPEPALEYKQREVTILRPAAEGDSFYVEGQDQVVVQFKDDGSQATAYRADVTPMPAPAA